jgi:hypothetical protein
MIDKPEGGRPHIVLTNSSLARQYTARSSGGGKGKDVPKRDRQTHGEQLRTALRNACEVPLTELDSKLREEMDGGLGLQITFVGYSDSELAFESLANEPARIEILSVRTEGEATIANVFIPDGKIEHFEKYITAYLEEKKDRNGKPIDHRILLDTIQTIRSASLHALWTDDIGLFPSSVSESIWWEVWLPVRNERNAVLADFRKLAEHVNCKVSDHEVKFPERTVVLLYGSRDQLTQSALMLNCVAELRRAKDTAEFFDGMGILEQQEWMDDALRRLVITDKSELAPRICLIDSGVNRAHPLLQSFMDSADLHSVNQSWGIEDQANHGTGQAGLAVYGNFIPILASRAPIRIGHRLESSKIIQYDKSFDGTAVHHAYLFAEAVSRPEISAPNRPRVFTSAVTAEDFRDRGRPSSWSAMVDQLSSDGENNGESPRLIVLAAGNTRDRVSWRSYPDSLSTNQIHDPGQSWNALTVGAFTELTTTEHETLEPIANEGGLSPYTTTSSVWDKAWPLKPDVVFEGGNVGNDAYGAVEHAPLNLLTTNANHLVRLFTTSNATSAASALCARMTAQIMAEYPQLRPETVRGLIVHSAEWTGEMRRMYLIQEKSTTKKDIENLIRHCGWGVPDHSRAMWSLSNSLTLIAEDQLHPYLKRKSDIKTRDMNLHALPWPKDQLEELQNTVVKMRVTLSYFIEPNPSARGVSSKYHYPSHRLRFDVKRPLETDGDFVSRINKAAETSDEGPVTDTSDSSWLLGAKKRHRGSLHQDEWTGTAADLASRGMIAVYPATGWWRTRRRLEKHDVPARYSLIVSIRTEQNEVDLYNAIEQQIETSVVNKINL